jgi:hypothetical protein
MRILLKKKEIELFDKTTYTHKIYIWHLVWFSKFNKYWLLPEIQVSKYMRYK